MNVSGFTTPRQVVNMQRRDRLPPRRLHKNVRSDGPAYLQQAGLETTRRGCTKMRIAFLLAAAALVTFAGSGDAAAKRKWFAVNYAHGSCMTSPWTPEEFHTMQFAMRSSTGIDMDPIAPDDVEKDAAGNIHVHETGSGPTGAVDYNFFTSKDDCDKFVKNEGITPQQAPSSDIN